MNIYSKNKYLYFLPRIKVQLDYVCMCMEVWIQNMKCKIQFKW